MFLHFTPPTVHPTRGPRLQRWSAPPGWWDGALLVLFASDASAAALSRLVTSAGALAALAALLVMKSWPAHLPTSALPTAGGALAVAGGALWWWLRAPSVLAATPAGARSVGHFAPAAAVALPSEFDRERLQSVLRRQFVELQAAWDRGDMVALGALTTPDMLAELCLERPGCVAHDTVSGSTDVVTVHADLLGFEVLAQDFVVSVEFSGLIRESANGGAVPFRELWMLTRSNREAEGWRLARHQALL